MQKLSSFEIEIPGKICSPLSSHHIRRKEPGRVTCGMIFAIDVFVPQRYLRYNKNNTVTIILKITITPPTTILKPVFCSYGDKAPRTTPGKLVGVMWMLAGLIITTMFISIITSALTSVSMAGRTNLRGVTVGVGSSMIELVQQVLPVAYFHLHYSYSVFSQY